MLTLLLSLSALGVVAKNNDSTVGFAVPQYWCADVGHGNGHATGVPEHFIVYPVNLAVAQRGINRALVLWVGPAIGVGVVVYIVGLLTQYLLSFPAENAGGGGVADRRNP